MSLIIKNTIDRLASSCTAKEGKAFSRYKSWEYCHAAFLEAHEYLKNHNWKLNEDQKEYLSLQLHGYLASWGMLRDSFLLQRDYKTHREAVRIILDKQYDSLWEYDPSDPKNKGKHQTIARKVKEIANKIEKSYNPTPDRYLVAGNQTKLSATLITKILMGTFAVVPAFDRFFIDGINRRKSHPAFKGEPLSASFSEKSIENLFVFAEMNASNLNASATSYPPMKKVDMYFWELGFEKGLVDGLSKNGTNGCARTKKKLLEQLKPLLPQTIIPKKPKTNWTFNDLLGEIDAIKTFFEI